MSKYTKEQLVEFATTHVSLAVRKGAAEALYHAGRSDAANEIKAVLSAPKPDENPTAKVSA